MKKLLFILPFLMILTSCGSGSGSGSDIDAVKGGVMEFNKTTTLGQALDNWKSCENSNWSEFETSNGIKVVQFKCQHKIIAYMKKAKSLLPKKEQAEATQLDITSNVQTFQFTINKDDSFQIDNVQVKTTWSDGTSFNDSQKPVEQLETAYKNSLNFDPRELNKNTAEQISYAFSLIKDRAK